MDDGEASSSSGVASNPIHVSVGVAWGGREKIGEDMKLRTNCALQRVKNSDFTRPYI